MPDPNVPRFLTAPSSSIVPPKRRGDVRLPDFVMLGQGKAGTSLIFRELQRRRDVGLSKRKELHYFNDGQKTGEAAYVAQFDEVPPEATVVGEIAPNYLSVEAIDRILATLGPQTKLIVSLRHPVEQAYSRYIQNIAAGNENDPFRLPPQILARRLSALMKVLRHLHARVPAEQILMLNYETDIAAPRPAFRRKVADFLGIPRRRPPRDLRGTRVNAGVMPRFVWSGDAPLEFSQADTVYRIPRRTLVFCAQSRNSQVWRKPTRKEVCDALARQSRWTPLLEETQYEELREGAVLQAAEALETTFGLDLAHWRAPARRLQYSFAPPPERFRKDGAAEPEGTVPPATGVPA